MSETATTEAATEAPTASSGYCQCAGPGYCARWGRYVSKSGHRICSKGVGRCVAAYFGVPGEPTRRVFAPEAMRGGVCAYRGEAVLDEHGRQATTQCATCRGTVRLKLWACSHPGHANDPQTTEKGCRSCGDWSAELPKLPFDETLYWLGGVERMEDRPGE